MASGRSGAGSVCQKESTAEVFAEADGAWDHSLLCWRLSGWSFTYLECGLTGGAACAVLRGGLLYDKETGVLDFRIGLVIKKIGFY